MWLNRYGGQPSPSSASPVPQRRPSHLAPTSAPQRPGLTPRASSLSLLLNGSTDSLPHDARYANGSSLKRQLDVSPTEPVSDPVDVLRDILGPAPESPFVENKSEDGHARAEAINFEGLSLQEFADADDHVALEQQVESSSHSFEECRSGQSIP